MDKAEAPSNSLSLGQSQKLAVAGVLAISPDIFILDEAVSMLDSVSRQNIYELLRTLHKKGKTIIHITHDLEAVKEAQNVIGMENGGIFYNGLVSGFLDTKAFVRKITGEPLKVCDRSDGGLDAASVDPTFSFKDICFSYEKNEQEPDSSPFIKNVSFDLYSGTLTALTGASGAGKSTLLEIGAGLLIPQQGTVYSKEHPALAQQNCSAALFEAFAADDVAFGPKNSGIHKKELVALVRSSMDMAGLPFEVYGERQSAGLSGGEQRRLAIAGILAMNRDVIFFDEPTAGLDGTSRSTVMKMMRTLADQGKTVLFTTHHKDEADFADREIKIENGQIVSDTMPRVGLESNEAPETLEGSLSPIPPYPSASMLTSLKNASKSLSGSGWKKRSPLEKLGPGLRILLFLALFVTSLLSKNIIMCSAMLVVSIIYCTLANFRLKRILLSFVRILPFLCFFALFQLMFRQPLADEIRYTTWKYFTVTPSKLLFCLNSILRTYACLYCVSAFFISTPEQDLIDGLRKIIPSRSFILVLEVIFRFIPLLVDESELIVKTQIIRGGLGKVKGKLAKIKAVVPLVVPLIIRTVRRSEILADAITMRGFNKK
ncbi:MAG: ATP-binding cassette domain-containing protein [Treponema sp.]|nr:ATP-binding cassette domain-containing protein [Treponema sp.]